MNPTYFLRLDTKEPKWLISAGESKEFKPGHLFLIYDFDGLVKSPFLDRTHLSNQSLTRVELGMGYRDYCEQLNREVVNHQQKMETNFPCDSFEALLRLTEATTFCKMLGVKVHIEPDMMFGCKITYGD